MTRIAFLDFEASSLGKSSYPIEVAWVFADGGAESFLIRPAPAWTDWAPEAEAVHGISRQRLVRDGVPHDRVALHMLTTLRGVALYASAPSWDGKWLSRLLRSSGLPRHALRLGATAEAQRRAILDILAAGGLAPAVRDGVAGKLMTALRQEAKDDPAPDHRALEDARRECRRWQRARDRAGAVIRAGVPSPEAAQTNPR
ncbi:transcriptional regulator [Methylobacterium sp. J-068]|uniref:3'-5' exonuclease n=1 Tax=Methylobacterium sp. J-068 TaxID=2836649 RepID=UPI001FBBE074|nr:transcriptional regulator [Methylobacterium sp. J-068]MCJ2036220.1 transcriptional regulator [Methylobacterium sp. J-068]